MWHLSSVLVLAIMLLQISSAVVLPRKKIASLEIRIKHLKDTQLRATLTNSGGTALRLLRDGSILDTAPVEKLRIRKPSNSHRAVLFEGVKKSIRYRNLPSSAFVSLDVGKSIVVELDIASAHDLTSGGIFNVFANARIAIAKDSTNDIAGSVALKSNDLNINVDPETAKSSRSIFARFHKRATNGFISPDCTASQAAVISRALENCVYYAPLASNFSQTALNSKIEEYFGASDVATRQRITDRYKAVASECSASDAMSKLAIQCTDTFKYCTESTLAFTLSPINVVTFCPSYFGLLDTTTTCHVQDKITTTIHEYTHSDQVFSPATQDFAYGYANLISLNTADKQLNADSFGMFVNAMRSDC